MKLKSIVTVLLFTCLLYSCGMAEGGVRTANNMEKYAIDYILENNWTFLISFCHYRNIPIKFEAVFI